MAAGAAGPVKRVYALAQGGRVALRRRIKSSSPARGDATNRNDALLSLQT